MSSTQRAYAQRNNNVTTLIPVFNSSGSYSLNLPSYYVGGIYIVDLSGNDSSGNVIDGSETISPDAITGSSFPQTANIVTFYINTPVIPPSSYPGAEFTIFFKNYPANIQPIFGEGPPLFTIGITSQPFFPPYILSPPLPVLFTNDFFQSITLKSQGVNDFSVVSSGPAGWLGYAAFISLLSTPFGQNDVTTIVPDASGAVDISYSTIANAFIYPLVLPDTPFIGGQYIVDLSENGLDASGDATIPLNGSGVVSAGLGGYDGSANVIMFYITPPESNPYNYTGNEFTLVFKNVPANTTRTYGGQPILTIGITDNATFGNSNIWFFSSPVPLLGPPNNIAHTLTLKYDGDKFNVVSSGPAGWLSLSALRQLLAVNPS